MKNQNNNVHVVLHQEFIQPLKRVLDQYDDRGFAYHERKAPDDWSNFNMGN